MTQRTPSIHPGTRLRQLMNRPGVDGCVMMPGAFNALCARAIAQAGFEGCYISGAATTVSAGVPDIGLLTLDHFAKLTREVCDAARLDDGTRLPVIVDADTGFGEGEMCRRTVIEYHRAGAAGLHIEDQVFPKRCGHLDGKALIPIDQAADKVARAAKAARECSGGGGEGFIVCARTDARGVEGFDAAVQRAKAYAQAGAEMIFPEGLASADEFKLFADKVRPNMGRGRGAGGGPYLLANMTEFGKTPIIPHQQFAAMGYSVVIYPVTLLRAAMGAVTRALATLKQEGSAFRLLDGMQSREELYKAIGYTPGREWEFPAP